MPLPDQRYLWVLDLLCSTGVDREQITANIAGNALSDAAHA